MSRRSILILAVLTLWSYGFVDISDANKSFLSSDYRGAIDKYRAIIEQNVEDADLYYNLATAYLYAGEYGNAIFWYYRSMMLNGTSQDIERNMKIAVQSLAEEGIVAQGSDSIIFEILLKYYNPYIGLAFILLLNLLFFILILKRFLKIKRDIRGLIMTLTIIVVILGIVAGLRVVYMHLQERGIVLERSVDVKEGPSEAYKTLSQLNEGMMVRVRERYDQFLFVEIIGRNIKGWVPSSKIGTLKVSRL